MALTPPRATWARPFVRCQPSRLLWRPRERITRVNERHPRWASDIGQETRAGVSGKAPWRRKGELGLKRRSEDGGREGHLRWRGSNRVTGEGGQDEGDEGLLLQRVPLPPTSHISPGRLSDRHHLIASPHLYMLALTQTCPSPHPQRQPRHQAVEDSPRPGRRPKPSRRSPQSSPPLRTQRDHPEISLTVIPPPLTASMAPQGHRSSETRRCVVLARSLLPSAPDPSASQRLTFYLSYLLTCWNYKYRSR